MSRSRPIGSIFLLALETKKHYTPVVGAKHLEIDYTEDIFRICDKFRPIFYTNLDFSHSRKELYRLQLFELSDPIRTSSGKKSPIRLGPSVELLSRKLV